MNFTIAVEKLLEDTTVLRDVNIRKQWQGYLKNPDIRFRIEQALGKDKISISRLEKLIQEYKMESTPMVTPTLDFEDFSTAYRTDKLWLFEDLIPATGLTLLSGPPKGGKSTLARHISWCVASGKDFLNFRNCNPGSVLWISGDERKPELIEKSNRAFHPKPVHSIKLIHGLFSDFEDLLEERLESLDEKPSLVVLDTLASGIHAEDFNSYAEMGKKLGLLNAQLEQWQIPMLAITHTRKGYGSYSTKRLDFEDVLGSAAVRGSVSATLLLYCPQPKEPDLLYLSREVRLQAGLSNQLMKMDYEHERINYADTNDKSKFKRANSRESDEATAERLFQMIVLNDRVPTKEEARVWLGIDKNKSNRAYDMLKKEGKISGTSQNRRYHLVDSVHIDQRSIVESDSDYTQ